MMWCGENEASMWFYVVGMSALSFRKCLDLATGKASGLEKLLQLSSKVLSSRNQAQSAVISDTKAS